MKVEHLTAEQRKDHQVIVGGTLKWATRPDSVDTAALFSKQSGPGHGIYVMDGDGSFYLGSHHVGLFHHSSFLSGANVAGAGDMKVEAGRVKAISNHSGHYKPKSFDLRDVILELRGGGAQLADDLPVTRADMDPPQTRPLRAFLASFEAKLEDLEDDDESDG